MSPSTAIAVLFTPAVETTASGYGAYFKPANVNDWPANPISADLLSPQELFAQVKYAAWRQGVMVAPLISINNWEYGVASTSKTIPSAAVAKVAGLHSMI